MAAAERAEGEKRRFAQFDREGGGEIRGDPGRGARAVFGGIIVKLRPAVKQFPGRRGDGFAGFVFDHADLDLAPDDPGLEEEQAVGRFRVGDPGQEFRAVARDARADRTARARRLDEEGIAELVFGAKDGVAVVPDRFRKAARDRDPGGGEQGFGQVLVH